jgi:hypothetical protein
MEMLEALHFQEVIAQVAVVAVVEQLAEILDFYQVVVEQKVVLVFVTAEEMALEEFAPQLIR